MKTAGYARRFHLSIVFIIPCIVFMSDQGQYGKLLQRSQNFYNLPGERHNVHLLYFHACGWKRHSLVSKSNSRHSAARSSVGRTKQRAQLQSAYNGEIALIVINIRQKLGHLFRFGDGGSARDPYGAYRAGKVCDRIATLERKESMNEQA